MNEKTRVAVSMGGTSLSLEDWLAHLRRRGLILPLLRDALVEQFLVDQAGTAGLSVSTDELQQAANAFRQRHGLASAADTNAWLGKQRLATVDLEEALERDLLRGKLADQVTRDQVAGHFQANQAGYARARLRLILVQREDVARELASQIRDEGGDFAILARGHSLHPSRANGGQLDLVRRRQFPPASADAVFAAREGAVVGPVATPQGFALFLVEKLLPASLDAELTALIRQELFEAWLGKQLANKDLQTPLAEAV